MEWLSSRYPSLLDARDCLFDASFAANRSVIFFFRAEAGIRDIGVTGVQTCALPIFGGGLVGKSTVHDVPTERLTGYLTVKAGKVFAVEQSDRLAFLPRAVVIFFDLGGANAGPVEDRKSVG